MFYGQQIRSVDDNLWTYYGITVKYVCYYNAPCGKGCTGECSYLVAAGVLLWQVNMLLVWHHLGAGWWTQSSRSVANLTTCSAIGAAPVCQQDRCFVSTSVYNMLHGPSNTWRKNEINCKCKTFEIWVEIWYDL
jgi:hypothetical protein